MKECLFCETRFNAADRRCPSCGNSPEVVDGFDAYAPDLAHGGGGFKASFFPEWARLEEANFWFRARNKIVVWALGKYAEGFNSLLEIGCGTGFVLAGIASSFPRAKLSGSEIFVDGLAYASGRLPLANLMQMDARRIPFIDEFDVVGAFDVLEHIYEDLEVLEQLHKALKPNGVLMLTVPQHPWLWSALDDHACHVRRYSTHEIEQKVVSSGFGIIRSTSFVTTLLPPMIFSRFLSNHRKKSFDPAAELKINMYLNSGFEKLLDVECAGIRAGMNYPFGGSRLLVAHKL